MTGEEFICWSSIDSGKFAGTYLGTPEALRALHHYLGPAVPYTLTPDFLAIDRRDWLETLYCPEPVELGKATRLGAVEVVVEPGCVRIRDGGHLVYDGIPASPLDLDDRIETFLAAVRRRPPAQELRIGVTGAGNGHGGNASSFVVEIPGRRIWIDPAPRPHETLALSNCHWDDVTDLLVTHIHEDHLGGLTACLARARAKGAKCRLWITRPSLEVLEQRLAAIVPDLSALIEFHEIVPGQPSALGEARLITRLNHHVLPCGTLGLKVAWNDRCVGISGDTKYDEAVLRCLGRPELEAGWFAECQLVFHEIDPTRPRSVHSYYLEVLKLAKRLQGRLVVYHAVGNVAPLEMAVEGRWYRV